MSCEVSVVDNSMQVGCRVETGGEVTGGDIGRMAARDPAAGHVVCDVVLNTTLDPEARREIARGIAQSMPVERLSELAETADGRALLERARAELKANPHELASARIDAALKSAELKKSDEFKALDPDSQRRVLDCVGLQWPNAGAVDNVIALAKSTGFQSASPDTRKELLSALWKHPTDATFCTGLQSLAKDCGKLTPTQQANAIRSFSAVAEGEAYRGRAGNGWSDRGKQVSDAEKQQVLDNARRVVTCPGFDRVGADAQQAMMGALAKHANDEAFAKRLVGFANDPGLAGLNDAGKQAKLLRKYGDDPSFADGIDQVMANRDYATLGSRGANVLNDLLRFSKTKSFMDAKQASETRMVEILGDVSAATAADPANRVLRNSVEQVIDGKIPLSTYSKPYYYAADGKRAVYGETDKGHVSLNMDNDVLADAMKSHMDRETVAHEVNHAVNSPDSNTKDGTADEFLDEYRAGVAGKEAAYGRKLTPEEEKQVLDNLVNSASVSYADIRALYRSDKKFAGVIDGMYATLNGSTRPAATVDAEEARQRLLDAGLSSDYLKKPGNVDNH